jgi:hypothetical protein
VEPTTHSGLPSVAPAVTLTIFRVPVFSEESRSPTNRKKQERPHRNTWGYFLMRKSYEARMSVCVGCFMWKECARRKCVSVCVGCFMWKECARRKCVSQQIDGTRKHSPVGISMQEKHWDLVVGRDLEPPGVNWHKQTIE